MKIPGFFLLKPVQYGLGIAAIVGMIGLWYRGKINDAKDEAINDYKMAANDTLQKKLKVVQDSAAAVVKATRDSLRDAQLRADVERRRTVSALASYNAARAAIDVNAPQPAGVPVGHVVVPIAFVVAADSAIKMLPILLEQSALERAASQRTIAAFMHQDSLKDVQIGLIRAQVTQLEVALKAAQPSLMDRAKDAALGGAIIYGAVQLLGRK